MAVYSCEEVSYQRQGLLNIVVVEDGEQCAITTGPTKMLLWFVDSWDSLQLVCIFASDNNIIV